MALGTCKSKTCLVQHCSFSERFAYHVMIVNFYFIYLVILDTYFLIKQFLISVIK